MRLVVDTGIIISALLRDSATREVLLFHSHEFLLPEYALEELEKYKGEISRRSGLSGEEIDVVLSLISENVTIVPASKIKPFLQRAAGIIGHVDPFDVPFMALALSTQNDGIWSNDRHFEALEEVRVWKTSDILKLSGRKKG